MGARVVRRLYFNYINKHRSEVLGLETQICDGWEKMTENLEITIRDGKPFDDVMATYMGQSYYGCATELMILCKLTPGLGIQIYRDGGLITTCGGAREYQHTFRLKHTGEGAASHPV